MDIVVVSVMGVEFDFDGAECGMGDGDKELVVDIFTA